MWGVRVRRRTFQAIKCEPGQGFAEMVADGDVLSIPLTTYQTDASWSPSVLQALAEYMDTYKSSDLRDVIEGQKQFEDAMRDSCPD
jgi:hypothetical protein